MSIKNKELDHDIEMFKKYKNLLGELTKKNVKMKYRNSWLGILWSFFQPLLNMIVLSVVFGGLFGAKGGDVICYPIYLFTGRLLFSFFTTATKQAMTSFRSNQAIIKKVYVPKYMYPLSSILSSFVNLAISLLCLICVWIFFRASGISGGDKLAVTPYALLCWVPMLILLVFATGIGLILSVVSVFFRDIEYIWDVLSQLLFYMVPIIYHIDAIETEWIVKVIKINPLYSMIEMFRSCILYGEIMDWHMLLYSLIIAVCSLIIGIIFFNWKSDEIIYHL
ncbi:MAG: ABC transporter permease [Eubacterium sp.]|nr:ABC transporter permease [Eubacterium sp.]MDE6767868.1 ABC transporter permease [Eubacterium sp.]